MAEYNLKSPHVSCIYYLYKAGSLTAKQLCDICDEDKASVSRSIEYLENNGYIECNSLTQKRYKSPLKLTEQGKSIGEAVCSKIDNILNEASSGLLDADRGVMYRSLKLISENLQKIVEKYED